MNNIKYIEYYLDIIFKVIPKCNRPYKLMRILTIDDEKNKTILVWLVLFQLWILFPILIFSNIHELFDFIQYILHMDYEKALEKVIRNNIT